MKIVKLGNKKLVVGGGLLEGTGVAGGIFPGCGMNKLSASVEGLPPIPLVGKTL